MKLINQFYINLANYIKKYVAPFVLLIVLAVAIRLYFIMSRDSDEAIQSRIFNQLLDESHYLAYIIGFSILSITVLLLLIVLRYVLNNRVAQLESTVKKLEKKNAEVGQMAYYDQLTGLPNRYFYKKEITNIINEKKARSLLVGNIRDFQSINSLHGSNVGDELLKQIGTYLVDKPESELFNAYLGNNTYAFIYDRVIKEENMSDLILRNEKVINDNISNGMHIKAQYMYMPEICDFDSYDSLNEVCEYLLDLVRESDDKFYVYYNVDNEFISESIRYRGILRTAIDQDLFEVYYQKKVNTVSKEVSGLEALARLTYDGEVILPGRFIPIIESNNMGIEFGWAIIKKVLSAYQQVIDTYYEGIIISINVSAELISDPEFVDKLLEMLERFDVPANVIELEVTESIVIKNFSRVRKIITLLRSRGLRIAIDDFGTGYSALQYFSELPMDVVKIDKIFVDRIGSDYITESIIKAILDIATIANIEVVAEGVEHEYQQQALQELGCDMIQGFLYSKPKPLSQINNKTIIRNIQ